MNKSALINAVVNQMIKCGTRSHIKITAKQKKAFVARYGKQIQWAVENLPRTSAALPAVVVKCMIKYNDDERIIALTKALKISLFDGKDDPAYHLSKFLERHVGSDYVSAYKSSVAACRAYMERRKITKIKPAQTDVFDFDEDFTVPDEFMNHWSPDKIPTTLEESK